MGIQIITSSDSINMKTFIAFSAILAIAAADVSSHATIQHGHGPVVSHAVHQPHHGPAIVHAPVVHPAPAFHHRILAHPAPVHVAHPAPVVRVAPVVVPHPAPVVKVSPVVVPHPAPAPYHAPAPAPYHAPHPAKAYSDDLAEPPVYGYEYAVADDYSKAAFGQNEARDGYKTSGSYRVALPDGRTQIVTYRVDDATSGYVADVTYEGVAAYPEAKAYHPAPAPYHPAPAPYHAAPVVAVAKADA